jgi:hypothetical protein
MAYPTLASGRTFCTPTTITSQCRTRIHTFTDGTEQRWRVGPALARLSVSHLNIVAGDVEDLEQFFDAQFGKRDDFSITVNGVTYDHMVLGQDDLKFTQSKPLRWDCTVQMKQIHG